MLEEKESGERVGKREIKTYQAKAGMITARKVLTADGRLIIPEDTELTPKMLRLLSDYMIEKITIYWDKPKPKEEKAELSYQEKVRSSKEFKRFEECFQNTVSGLKGSMQEVIESAEGDGRVGKNRLLYGVDSILENSRNGLHTIEMLHCMREFDDMTYVHCVNVSLLCNTIGEWLNYKGEELRTLMLAGLLHDIGKLKIPAALIKKPGRLTDKEYALMKKHTIFGYEILKHTDLEEEIAIAALAHHERSDGSGYPLGLLAAQVDEISSIVAVADVYDAMTADRVYRKGICPFEVIEAFEREGIEKYDPHVLLSFLNKIVQSYIGASVLLSNGQTGEVVMTNTRRLSKPVVRIGDEFVDLSKEKDISIQSVVR